MKKIFILKLIIFNTILFYSCDRNVMEIPVEINISNETGKSMEIHVFESVSQNFVKKIEITNGNMVSRIFMEKESDSPIGPKDFFEGDSISIVFGTNEKILTSQCQYFIASESCAIEGNILNISDSRWQLENNGDTVIRSYTFMPEDFENAEPIN
jgi:hypothetical protein